VSEWVIAIGGATPDADRDKNKNRGRDVDERIERVGQNGERAESEPRPNFRGEQKNVKDEKNERNPASRKFHLFEFYLPPRKVKINL